MLKKWCEVIACDGVIDLYESKENKKHFVFWTVVMMGMLSCSIWFTYRTIVGFIETPTVTNVDTVTSPNLDLPEILIQYNGGINVSAMKEANLSDEFIRAFSASFNFKYSTLNIPNRAPLLEALNTTMKHYNYTNYIDIAKKFGYRCDELISLITETNGSTHGCEHAEFFITNRVMSYVFRKNVPQWYPGLWGGIRFDLTAPKNSFVQIYPEAALETDMNDDFYFTFEQSLGHFLSGRSYMVPMNTKTEITLNTYFYKRLNFSRQCAENEFTSNTCFYDCWMNEIQRCLGCLPFVASGDGSRYNNSQICNPFEYSSECVNYSIVQLCNKKCIPLCNEWIYQPTIAYSSLSSLSLNKSVSTVVIGYNTMQYTKMEEVQAFTLDMAISSVGGQPGLWLGISIITVIQTLYYSILGLFQKKEKSIRQPPMKAFTKT